MQAALKAVLDSSGLQSDLHILQRSTGICTVNCVLAFQEMIKKASQARAMFNRNILAGRSSA